MKALTLTEYKNLVFGDVPDPRIADDEVLVRVRACGICGSDVHGMDGSTGRRRPPIIMGHEAAGVIAEVGNQVKDWKIGDRVTFDSTVFCGACWYCQRGLINLCDNRRVSGSLLRRLPATRRLCRIRGPAATHSLRSARLRLLRTSRHG